MRSAWPAVIVVIAAMVLSPSSTVLTQSPAPAKAPQNGLSYRFRENTLTGTVWVLGENARRELESGENGLAAGRVEIWKDGGRQVLSIDPRTHTYYDAVAFWAKNGAPRVAPETLTVRSPFKPQGVDDIQASLSTSPRTEDVSGYACRRSLLTFSYRLTLAIDRVAGTSSARVEGTQDVCLADVAGAPVLPFGHRTAISSGHPDVDRALAEQVSALGGIPVAQLIKVSRRIEGGENVQAVSVLLLSDIRRDVPIAPDRFEVPAGYRFAEPAIVPPSRRQP